MKIIVLIFFLISLFSNISNAANFKWSKVVTSGDKTTTFYLDKRTVYQVGTYKYFWQLADYIDKNEEVNSVISHMVVNCETNETKIIVFTSYTGQMANGNIIDDLIIAEESIDLSVWKKFPANKTQGRVLIQVCKIR